MHTGRQGGYCYRRWLWHRQGVEGERIDRVFNISAKNMGITYEQVVANSNARAALGRMVKPEEVAALAVFLASDKSSGITGQTVNIDAGVNFN